MWQEDTMSEKEIVHIDIEKTLFDKLAVNKTKLGEQIQERVTWTEYLEALLPDEVTK